MFAKQNDRRLEYCVIIVLSLVAAARCQQQVKGTDWTLADVQCAPEDSPTAINRLAAFAETHCAMLADVKARTGALVAQFNKLSSTCTVFNFQSICRHLIPGRTPNCAVFYRFPINHRSMNAKLNNVWLADAVSRLENLVCQADEDTNRLHPVAVQWNSEGAVFDGAAAHAVLNKSSLSFATGLTWLLRIKRPPRVQPLIEFTDCNSPGSFSTTHIWEYSSARMIYSRRGMVTGTKLPWCYSATNVLSASSEDWQNIGFTSSASGDSFDIFVQDHFLSRDTFNIVAEGVVTAPSSLCLHLGMRLTGPPSYFLGTVRALAFASVNMSEAEIREFFTSTVT